VFDLPRGLFTRDFRLLFAGQAASLLGDGLFYVALSFAVLDVTDSERSLGLVLAAGGVPLVVFSLVGGVWADRLERRRIMLAADASRAAIQILLAALVVGGNAELWHFLLLQAAYGTAQAFFGPASTGLIPQILDADLLRPANGLLGATRAATFVGGSALGGFLVDGVGPGTAIGLDASTFGVSAACLVSIRRLPPTTSERRSFQHELAEGFREVRRHRWLWLTLINAALFVMLYVAPLEVLGPVVARDELGGAAAWGIVAAAFSLGEIVGGVGAATVRVRRPLVIAASLFLVTGVTPVLFAVAAPVWVIATGMGIEGLALGVFLAVWEAEIQNRIPLDRISRVSAWDWMISVSGMPLGFVLGGVLADAIGLDQTLYLMAGAGVLLSLWMLTARDIRNIGARA
jgi:MFS family permease